MTIPSSPGQSRRGPRRAGRPAGRDACARATAARHRAFVSCGLLILCTTTLVYGQTAPLHLWFWQPADVCDAQNVRFEAHPFPTDRRTVLLQAEKERPSLWYMPTDVAPTAKGLRIYYQRVEKSLPDYAEQRTWCMGVLKGDTFERPDLGLYPQSWGGPANVVLRRSPHKPTWGGFNVFQMVGDGRTGYRLLYWDQPAEGPAGAMLATSPDGIHWTKSKRGAVFTEHNDAYALVRERDGGGYLLYQTRLEPWPDKHFRDNLPGQRRVISLRTSKDLIEWSAQRTILRPDAQDAPHAEFYLQKVFGWADRYVGLLMKYYADPSRPGKHGSETRCELIFSRDGVRWDRPYRATDLGAWSYAEPFEHDGDLCLVAHDNRNLVLFRTRRDGLASCGSDGAGSFCTQPFTMPDADLTLNADCTNGSVTVELLDGNGRVLEGFESANCRLAGVDRTDLPLQWRNADPRRHVGRPVRLRFHVTSARLYSLAGASRSSDNKRRSR